MALTHQTNNAASNGGSMANEAAVPNSDKGVARTHANERETGLLTRWVPERVKHSAAYRAVLRLARVLQPLSAVISLGIFSARMYKVYRLVNAFKTRRGVDGAYGAVEGILAAAVLYTLVATLLRFLLRGGGPRWLRWLWVLLDLCFVGAFIAVAVLTSPNGGMAGPGHCYGSSGDEDDGDDLTGSTVSSDRSCNLPWGTFILAIVSTILHAITAAFHEAHDHGIHHRVKGRHSRRTEERKYAQDEQNRNGGRLN